MADTASVSAGGTATSNAFTLQTDTVLAYIQCKADNSTTAASDDIIHFKALESLGDVDNDATVDYATVEAAPTVAVLDTNAADPQVSAAVPIAAAKTLQVYADGATEGTTNAITVSAFLTEVGVDGVRTESVIDWP